MSTPIAIIIGLVAGFALATFLQNGSQCCASLGKAAFTKYGIPDLGSGLDSTAGGLISQLGLA